MARKGKELWEKYYTEDNISTIVKIANPYYSDVNGKNRVGYLTIGQEVVYDNPNSQHISRGGNLKIAFRFPGNPTLYYSTVDNFAKPGRSDVNLKPSFFGMSNKLIEGKSNYVNELKKAIDSKAQDLGQDLTEYLLALVDFAAFGNATNFDNSTANINKSSIPWGQINSYFSELIGPLACVSGRCTGFPPNMHNAKIYIAPDSNNLFDYEITHNNEKYRVSAKAGRGSSNTLKPNFIIQELERITGDASLNDLKNELGYELLKTLAENPAKIGPIVAYGKIYPSILDNVAVEQLKAQYIRNSDSTKIVLNVGSLSEFIKKHKQSIGNKQLTLGLVRYICETELEKWYKIGANNTILKSIFKKYINYSDIKLVKTVCGPRIRPIFQLSSGETFRTNKKFTLSLRNKNDSVARVDDKLGISLK